MEYNSLNVDDRSGVSNLSVLEKYEKDVEDMIISSRPKPVNVVVFDADNLAMSTYDSTITEGEFTLVATSEKTMTKKSKVANFTYAGETYSNTYGLNLGGSANFGTSRYVSFTVDGPCTVTVAIQSSGSDTRTLNMVDEAKSSVGSFEAGASITVSSVDISEAGTYSVGSAGSGIYVFMIIIEYFE